MFESVQGAPVVAADILLAQRAGCDDGGGCFILSTCRPSTFQSHHVPRKDMVDGSPTL